MKFITKKHAVVVGAASKDITRPMLNGVYLEETENGLRTTATDGRILATVEDTTPSFQPEGYPANTMPATAENSAKASIIPTAAFTTAIKGIPKRIRYPILGTVAVVMGKDTCTLATTDLDAPSVSTPKNIDGEFPSYKQVIPNKEATLAVLFNPELLGRACKMAKDFGLESMKLEFTTPRDPVKITGVIGGQNLTIVVMPMLGPK